MPSRRVLAALLVVLAVFVAAALLRTAPAGAATSRDELMKTSLVALQCAIEKGGSARMWAYPHPRTVSPTGGLTAAFWPRDPWTGRRLTPGVTRGHYVYVRAGDYRSYTLTGHLSGGRTFTVKGGMAHTPMLAYDHRGQEGLSLLFQYVKAWSRAHDGRLPTAAQVSRNGSVGRQRGGLHWPSNPWDHAAMEQRGDRGSFAYERSPDGQAFTLRLHRALKEDFVLRGGAAIMSMRDKP
jgi:hypothetical protein